MKIIKGRSPRNAKLCDGVSGSVSYHVQSSTSNFYKIFVYLSDALEYTRYLESSGNQYRIRLVLNNNPERGFTVKELTGING